MARKLTTTDRNIPHLRNIFGIEMGHSEEKALSHDSAVSMGSTSEEEEEEEKEENLKNNSSINKKKTRRRRDNSLTENDVKHLDRHLSMKKTIRKKIMRDLKQAFVEDPTNDIINIQSLSFGIPSAERSFLDMLRAEGSIVSGYQSESPMRNNDTDDEESNYSTTPIKKTGNFWKRFTIKNKNKR